MHDCLRSPSASTTAVSLFVLLAATKPSPRGSCGHRLALPGGTSTSRSRKVGLGEDSNNNSSGAVGSAPAFSRPRSPRLLSVLNSPLFSRSNPQEKRPIRRDTGRPRFSPPRWLSSSRPSGAQHRQKHDARPRRQHAAEALPPPSTRGQPRGGRRLRRGETKSSPAGRSQGKSRQRGGGRRRRRAPAAAGACRAGRGRRPARRHPSFPAFHRRKQRSLPRRRRRRGRLTKKAARISHALPGNSGGGSGSGNDPRRKGSTGPLELPPPPPAIAPSSSCAPPAQRRR